MYQVIKTNIADRAKLVKAYWSKTFTSEASAKKYIEKQELLNCLFDYKIVTR